MRSHALYFPALLDAALGATLVPVSSFVEVARTSLVKPTTIAAGLTIFLLFMRLLFDRQCRASIEEAGRAMRKTRRKWFFDEQWGLFGQREGPRPVLMLRAVLLLEFIVTFLFSGAGFADLFLLAGASFGVTVMLGLAHIGLNPQSQQS